MPISDQTKIQILNLLNEYESAYNAHNVSELLATLAQDVRMCGCRKAEEVTGRDSYAAMMDKNFARYKTGSIRFDRVEIKGEGVVVWIDAACWLGSVNGAGEVSETYSRFTAVCRGTGHAWEFVQIHMSLGYPYHE